MQLAVGGDDLGGGGLVGGERGGEHVAAGEQFFVGEGGVVVVVEEPARRRSRRRRVGRRRRVRGCVARRGRSCRRRRAARHGPGPRARAAWLRCGRRARRCAPCRGGSVRGWRRRPRGVRSSRVTSQAAEFAVGHRHPRRVGRRTRLEGFGAGRVAVQPGGQDVIEPVPATTSTLSARDQAAVGDDADPPHPEAVLQVLEHAGQGGDIGGVAGEHVMRDGDPVAGAQQADHHLGPVRRWSRE